MARKDENPERRELIRQLVQMYRPKTAQDAHDVVKDLMGGVVQDMLEAELEDDLGYSKYDYKNKDTSNKRNGYSKKTVTSSMGEMELNIPRDREGEFEPQVVKKHQRDISNIEDQVLSMYAKGMTTRDITEHLQNIY